MESTIIICKVESIFNPNNSVAIRSYSSCEDRCNKLEVRRTKTNNSYS